MPTGDTYQYNSAMEKGFVHNGPEDNRARGGMHNYNNRTTCWLAFTPKARKIIVGVIALEVMIVTIVPAIIITRGRKGVDSSHPYLEFPIMMNTLDNDACRQLAMLMMNHASNPCCDILCR